MIENSKTIITLEKGEELVVGDIVLEAGDTFEVIEAKKDGGKPDETGPHGKGNGPGMKDDDSEEEKEEKEEKKKKESTVYTVEEDVKIGDIILEKGDKFEIVEAEESDADKKDKKDKEASKGKDTKDDEKDSGKKAKDDEKKKESVFIVEEDTPILGTDIVLKKGDKFKVL